jgi:hypothetical protein
VHFDGAESEALTYRVSFGQPDGEGRQALRLHVLTGDEASQDSAAGELVLEGRTGETASADGIRLWAGRASDTPLSSLPIAVTTSTATSVGPIRILSPSSSPNACQKTGG